MKYGEWTMGQTEALLNKLGGQEVALNILRGVVEVVIKVVSYLTATYQDIVNYDRTIADSVVAGKYNWSNENITDQNFPSTEAGTKEVEFGLFHFHRVVTAEDAEAGMKAESFRPATMKELLHFGEKHPELQREFPIVALGSVATLSGRRCVGYLRGYGSERGVDLYYCDYGWGDYCRFLAVRI